MNRIEIIANTFEILCKFNLMVFQFFITLVVARLLYVHITLISENLSAQITIHDTPTLKNLEKANFKAIKLDFSSSNGSNLLKSRSKFNHFEFKTARFFLTNQELVNTS